MSKLLLKVYKNQLYYFKLTSFLISVYNNIIYTDNLGLKVYEFEFVLFEIIILPWRYIKSHI